MERINLEFLTNLEKEGQKSVIDFCIKMGFIASSYECPECQKPMKLAKHSDRGQDGYVWICRHKSINRRSIRSGSWFQRSRLSVIMMIRLAYLWVKGTSYNWIADEFNFSKNTVCDWMAFFRRVCENALEREGMFIGGPNEIVEIDAKRFTTTKNKREKGTLIFGGVARTTKRCFLKIIQSSKENEIASILEKHVHPNSIIISDSWEGFSCLESYGYVHQKIGKTSGFKDQATGIHKNNILCLWGRVKKIVSKRIVDDQFYSHLAEIMWRRLHTEEDTQRLLRSFFKILSDMCPPRIKDDPAYVSKKVEMEEGNKGDFTKTESKDVNTDNLQGENISDKDSSENKSTEDDSGSENGRQNKRQKTIDSLNT